MTSARVGGDSGGWGVQAREDPPAGVEQQPVERLPGAQPVGLAGGVIRMPVAAGGDPPPWSSPRWRPRSKSRWASFPVTGALAAR